MKKLISRFSLVNQVAASTAIIVALSLLAVAVAVYMIVTSRISEEAVTRQNASLRVAATIVERDLPGTQITWAADGNVKRVVMESIPEAFEGHDMIDTVGRMTGETATIFAWEDDSKDFWRRTTNIVKPDGNRAVGTQLGQNGAVYPVIMKGETFRGEAVILGTPYYTIYQPIFSPAGETIGILYAGVRKEVITALSGQVTNAMLLVSLIVLVAAVGVMALIARGVMRPIPRLTATARSLAEGDMATEVPYAGNSNEIGELARALEVFKTNAAAKADMERQAEESRSLTESERAEREASNQREAEQLQAAVESLGGGLQKLATGDLTVRIDTPFIESLERLRSDFNTSVEKLRDTLSDIRENTQAIDNDSVEMRSAIDELSRRTETQAASLEETSAAIEQITSTVRNAAERARDASAKVAATKADTESSAGVVNEAVTAMGRIEQASGEISTIISVIEDIAFQTNLLALNAGVEAARAGEAGKGFAVVAQEVRELAQRSAGAAKEIKDLITKSSHEVSTGVDLVNKAGDALNSISSQVVEVNDNIQSIAQSASEQSTGLEEISTSINQLDDVTQRNAAMVEETNALTHRLSEEAGNLKTLIGSFAIGGQAAAARPAPAVAQARAASASAKGGTVASGKSARPVAANEATKPVASPARDMVGSIARAFSSKANLAVNNDEWEDF